MSCFRRRVREHAVDLLRDRLHAIDLADLHDVPPDLSLADGPRLLEVVLVHQDRARVAIVRQVEDSSHVDFPEVRAIHAAPDRRSQRYLVAYFPAVQLREAAADQDAGAIRDPCVALVVGQDVFAVDPQERRRVDRERRDLLALVAKPRAKPRLCRYVDHARHRANSVLVARGKLHRERDLVHRHQPVGARHLDPGLQRVSHGGGQPEQQERDEDRGDRENVRTRFRRRLASSSGT